MKVSFEPTSNHAREHDLFNVFRLSFSADAPMRHRRAWGLVKRVGRGRQKIVAGLRAARDVRRRTGKGFALQTKDIIKLRFGPSSLRPRDYYTKELFDDVRYPGSAKGEVGGKRLALKLSRSLNDIRWAAVARDKLVFDAVARSLGVPVPRILAVYHPGSRTHGDVACLRSTGEVVDFLRQCRSYPLFGKPVNRGRGQGATSLDAFLPQLEGLRTVSGEIIPVGEYVANRVVFRDSGYLFQERVAMHPELLELCGERLTSLRLAVLNGDEGPRLFRANWRVPTGRNHIDNFASGKTGNLLGSVDIRRGEVRRLVQGMIQTGRARRAPGPLAREVTRHPNTGKVLVGTILPDWERAVSMVLAASAALPGLRWIGWDVALGRAGPVVLEINRVPALPQIPGGPGAYDADLQAFLKRYGGG